MSLPLNAGAVPSLIYLHTHWFFQRPFYLLLRLSVFRYAVLVFLLHVYMQDLIAFCHI